MYCVGKCYSYLELICLGKNKGHWYTGKQLFDAESSGMIEITLPTSNTAGSALTGRSGAVTDWGEGELKSIGQVMTCMTCTPLPGPFSRICRYY